MQCHTRSRQQVIFTSHKCYFTLKYKLFHLQVPATSPMSTSYLTHEYQLFYLQVPAISPLSTSYVTHNHKLFYYFTCEHELFYQQALSYFIREDT